MSAPDASAAQDAGSVVVVTGLSGAGKSTALNAFEDLGYYCIDNLPTPVVGVTLDACAAGGMRRVALGIDVRVRSFLLDTSRMLDGIATGHELSVLFLDANDQALLRRYSGTRRPHPLSTNEEHPSLAVLDGIRVERERLAPLRARASIVIDTTKLSVHELRRSIVTRFGPGAGAVPRMFTRFMSFGFKYGPPADADLIFDVRFLKNPYFVPELRDFSGQDAAVRDYVLGDDDTQGFLQHAEGLLEFCLPRYEREGKSYLTVAIGCTGGRHRSVACAEWLAARLGAMTELRIEAVHRDIQRVSSEQRDLERGTGSETGAAEPEPDATDAGSLGGEGTT